MCNYVNFTEGVVAETLGEAVFGDKTISFEASICLPVWSRTTNWCQYMTVLLDGLGI
jgi:hypothetical protein